MARKPVWTTGGRTGPMRRFKKLVIFACEGLLAVHDERPGHEDDYVIVTPADMWQRIAALSAQYRSKTRVQYTPGERQDIDAVHRGCENIAECIREAREMGDPSDPQVQAWWARHQRNSTISFNLRPGSDLAGYPQLPQLPLGRYTGRTAEADAVFSPSTPVIHTPPRRKHRGQIIELS